MATVPSGVQNTVEYKNKIRSSVWLAKTMKLSEELDELKHLSVGAQIKNVHIQF